MSAERQLLFAVLAFEYELINIQKLTAACRALVGANISKTDTCRKRLRCR